MRDKGPLAFIGSHTVKMSIFDTYSQLPERKKQENLKRAHMGMQRYEKRMTTYNAPSQHELFIKYGYIPKRFVTSYAYFVKRNFMRVVRRHPEYSFVQASRHLAKRWSQLSEKQKKPYQEKFVADWRRWKREMHLYKEGHFRHNEGKHCTCCNKTGKRVTHVHKKNGDAEAVTVHNRKSPYKKHKVNTKPIKPRQRPKPKKPTPKPKKKVNPKPKKANPKPKKANPKPKAKNKK